MPDSKETLALLRRALREDIGAGDVTTRVLIPPGARARAVILCKAEGTVCGLPVARRVFLLLSPRISFHARFRDGDRVRPGDEVAALAGPARPMLAGERVALNLLCHLSGVATATRRLVGETGTRSVILDTRKTIPGLRRLQRYAVRTGGGCNHRRDLAGMILIKDNHLALAGGVGEAVRRARSWRAQRGSRLLIEVEVGDLAALREALSAGADRILLDNLDPAGVRRAVCLARRHAGRRVPIEVSGGIAPGRARAFARAGADFLSSGALTHSAPALDFSLEMTAP
jgi:nicotinate-nucleotide pyrophosphorylase (carboxylating)